MKYVLFAAVICAAVPARAGLTLVTSGSHGGHKTTTTVEMDGDKLRADSQEELAPPATGEGSRAGAPTAERGARTMLFDAAAKKMTVLDAAKKTYREITAEDMKAMRAKMDGMKAQMQEKLAGMPAAQRAQVEAMMGQRGGGMMAGKLPVRSYVALGTKRSVNGFACEDYKVLEDGVEREEDCISKFGAGIVKESDVAAFEKLSEEFIGGFGAEGSSLASWTKAPGIPIESTRLGPNGEKEIVAQVQSAKRGTISADRFVLPSGYTKDDSPMFGPGAHGPHGH